MKSLSKWVDECPLARKERPLEKVQAQTAPSNVLTPSPGNSPAGPKFQARLLVHHLPITLQYDFLSLLGAVLHRRLHVRLCPAVSPNMSFAILRVILKILACCFGRMPTAIDRPMCLFLISQFVAH
jgi:hypothetical protein